MKKSILFFVIVSLLALPVVAEDLVVSFVVGNVEYKANDTAKWQKAKFKLLLPADSIIQTKQGARVKLLFTESKVEMLIGENKTVKVKDIFAKKDSLMKDENKLKLNRLKAKMSKGSVDRSTEATAVAGVRGAKADKKQSTNTTELMWDE